MGHQEVKNKIIKTLTGRTSSNKIKPSEHQEFALALLEYIRSVELISGSTLIGVATETTTPVESTHACECYIAKCTAGQTLTFSNFKDAEGTELTYTAETDKSALLLLMWDRTAWTLTAMPISVEQVDLSKYVQFTNGTDEGEIPYMDMLDSEGNAIVRFKDGHVQTHNFDSKKVCQNIHVEGTKLIIE